MSNVYDDVNLKDINFGVEGRATVKLVNEATGVVEQEVEQSNEFDSYCLRKIITNLMIKLFSYVGFAASNSSVWFDMYLCGDTSNFINKPIIKPFYFISKNGAGAAQTFGTTCDASGITIGVTIKVDVDKANGEDINSIGLLFTSVESDCIGVTRNSLTSGAPLVTNYGPTVDFSQEWEDIAGYGMLSTINVVYTQNQFIVAYVQLPVQDEYGNMYKYFIFDCIQKAIVFEKNGYGESHSGINDASCNYDEYGVIPKIVTFKCKTDVEDGYGNVMTEYFSYSLLTGLTKSVYMYGNINDAHCCVCDVDGVDVDGVAICPSGSARFYYMSDGSVKNFSTTRILGNYYPTYNELIAAMPPRFSYFFPSSSNYSTISSAYLYVDNICPINWRLIGRFNVGSAAEGGYMGVEGQNAGQFFHSVSDFAGQATYQSKPLQGSINISSSLDEYGIARPRCTFVGSVYRRPISYVALPAPINKSSTQIMYITYKLKFTGLEMSDVFPPSE